MLPVIFLIRCRVKSQGVRLFQWCFFGSIFQRHPQGSSGSSLFLGCFFVGFLWECYVSDDILLQYTSLGCSILRPNPPNHILDDLQLVRYKDFWPYYWELFVAPKWIMHYIIVVTEVNVCTRQNGFLFKQHKEDLYCYSVKNHSWKVAQTNITIQDTVPVRKYAEADV